MSGPAPQQRRCPSDEARLRKRDRDREAKRRKRAHAAQLAAGSADAIGAGAMVRTVSDNPVWEEVYAAVSDETGSGSWGSVRKATVGLRSGAVAIAWKTVRWSVRTLNEVRLEAEFLKDINRSGKHPHIPHLLWTHFHRQRECMTLAMLPFFEPQDDFAADAASCAFTHKDFRAYCFAAVSAVRHVHAAGLVHLDIKPHNFLYHRASRRYLLVDYGLARRAEPLDRVTADAASAGGEVGLCVIGTRGWRAPETLLEVGARTTAADMWAVGMLCLSIASRTYNFMDSKDSWEQIATICDGRRLTKAADTVGRLPRLQAALRNVGGITVTCPFLVEVHDSDSKLKLAEPQLELELRLDCLQMREWLEAQAQKRGRRPLYGLPDAAHHLVWSLLNPDCGGRLTAAQAAEHAFLRKK